MNKEKILNLMIHFEHEVGEDFFDQGFNLHPLTLMSWCLGRGHLSKEKYDHWAYDYRTDKSSPAHEPLDFVYNHQKGYVDVPYALFEEEDMTDEGREKAYEIVAEFISEIELYRERFIEFMKDHEIDIKDNSND